MNDNYEVMPPQCNFCTASPEPIQVRIDDLRRYNQGAHIQHAFPEMPPADRERLLTGTHDACWDALFADDEEDDD